jgi:hypothetical protein
MNKRRLTILVLLGVMALAIMPAQAAPDVTPTFVEGNSTCASVGSTGLAFTVNDPVVDVEIHEELDGVAGAMLHVTGVERRKFDFSVEGALIHDVIVKGSGANWYSYGAAPVSVDDDLSIPNGNKLNVIHFCYGEIPNSPPDAVDDAASVLAGGSVQINVLANDTDADVDPLTIDSFTQPANGATVPVDGMPGWIEYTPSEGFAGPDDTFEYTISDGNGGSDTASVTVSVFEGELACGGSTDVETEAGMSAEFFRHGAGCGPAKPFTINFFPEAGPNGEIEFLIDPAFTEASEYTAHLTFDEFDPANPNVQTFTWDLDNPGGALGLAVWCDSVTFVDGVLVDAEPPSGEEGCIASSSTVAVGANEAQTTWWVYFRFDLKTRG